MADILIRGFEIPKNDSIIVAIRSDGKIEDVMGCYIGTAIELPEHGDLIDRNEIKTNMIDEVLGKTVSYVNMEQIKNAPVVIPATVDEMPAIIPVSK